MALLLTLLAWLVLVASVYSCARHYGGSVMLAMLRVFLVVCAAGDGMVVVGWVVLIGLLLVPACCY